MEILSGKWVSKAKTFKGKYEPKRISRGIGKGGRGFKAKNLFVGGVWISLHNRILEDPSEASSLKIIEDHLERVETQ